MEPQTHTLWEQFFFVVKYPFSAVFSIQEISATISE